MSSIKLTFHDGTEATIDLVDGTTFEEAVIIIQNENWITGDNFSYRTISIDKVGLVE